MIPSYLNSAGIAQLVEQRFCNPQVPRSIRGAGTIYVDISLKNYVLIGILIVDAV